MQKDEGTTRPVVAQATTPAAAAAVPPKKTKPVAIPKHDSVFGTLQFDDAKAFVAECMTAQEDALRTDAEAWLRKIDADRVMETLQQDLVAIASFIVPHTARMVLLRGSGGDEEDEEEEPSPPSNSEWTSVRQDHLRNMLRTFGCDAIAALNGDALRHRLFVEPLDGEEMPPYAILENTATLLGTGKQIRSPPPSFISLLANAAEVRVARESIKFTKEEILAVTPRRRCPLSGRVFKEGDAARELCLVFQITTIPDGSHVGTDVRRVWIFDGDMPGWLCVSPVRANAASSEAELKRMRTRADKRAKADGLGMLDAAACFVSLPHLYHMLEDRWAESLGKRMATASGLMDHQEFVRKAEWKAAKKLKSAAALAAVPRKANKVDRRYYELDWACHSEHGIKEIVGIVHDVKKLQIMFLGIATLCTQRAIQTQRRREEAAVKRRATLQAKRKQPDSKPVADAATTTDTAAAATTAPKAEGPPPKKKHKHKHSSKKKKKHHRHHKHHHHHHHHHHKDA